MKSDDIVSEIQTKINAVIEEIAGHKNVDTAIIRFYIRGQRNVVKETLSA